MIPIKYNREKDPRRKIKIESPRSQIWAWPRLNQLNPMEAILKHSKMAYFCFVLFFSFMYRYFCLPPALS